MWHYDLEAGAIPDFAHTHRSHSYSRTNVSSRGHCLEILHPPNDCTDCYAYKVHVLYTCLQDHATPEREWSGITGINSGHAEFLSSSPNYGVPHELSRVRTALRRARQERDDAIALNARYQNEILLLENQLQEAKDKLFAIQIACDHETQLWNTDLLVEESRGDGLLCEQFEQDNGFEDNLSSSNDSLDADLGVNGFWTMEHPIVPTDASSNASEDDLSDDFDLFQQFHLMTQEDENSSEDDSNEALQKVLQDTMNTTLPVYCTDSSSNSDSPSTSSSLLSASDWTGDQSDDSSFPPASLPSLNDELHRMLKLMDSAHEEGNTNALLEIKKLIVKSEKTLRHKRTAAQKYLLLNWRSPSSSSRINYSNSASLLLHPAAPSRYSSSSQGPEIFVDASGSGIGFVFGTHWLAWTFKKDTCKIPLGGDGKIVMSWAELLAVEVGLRALIAAGYLSTVVTVRSDNTGVVEALTKNSWCQRHGIEDILQNILNLCEEYGIRLRPRWVSTKTNIADQPSRGVFPPWSLAFKYPPKLPPRLSDLLELVVAPTA